MHIWGGCRGQAQPRSLSQPLIKSLHETLLKRAETLITGNIKHNIIRLAHVDKVSFAHFKMVKKS